jgi:hypothetical protein
MLVEMVGFPTGEVGQGVERVPHALSDILLIANLHTDLIKVSNRLSFLIPTIPLYWLVRFTDTIIVMLVQVIALVVRQIYLLHLKIDCPYQWQE